MAFEVSKDLTFFAEIMDNVQNHELAWSKKSVQTSNKRKTRKSLQKENKPETVTPKRESNRKSTRVPLKVLNTKVKTPKKDASSTEKNCQPKRKSTARASLPPPKQTVECPSRKRNNSGKVSASPSKTKAGKQEKSSLPKIIIYGDPSGAVKVQEKGNQRKSTKGLSKSWDGSVRKSHPGGVKSPKLGASQTKNVRRSLNNLSSIKSPSKTEKTSKNVAEDESSPAEKPRVTKLKPGQPEYEEMLNKLETLFPNVDPEFMRAQFKKLKGSLSEIIEFLITKGKTNELPSRDDYLRKCEIERLQNKFMENFSVVNFLKIIPDPWDHFLIKEKHNCGKYLNHSLHYLKNKYKTHYLMAIQEALSKNNNSLYLADKELKKKSRLLKMRATNRSKCECDAGRPTTLDMQFIFEVAFIENETKIKSHIKKAKTARHKRFMEAKEAGTLLECQSCNDFSLLQDDVVNCPANHVFCKDCVVKYVEVEVGNDNFQFKCLRKCDEKFSFAILQDVLSPPVMAKIIQRNQLELKSPENNNLIHCPFCYYVFIMSPELNTFKCLNPSCMLESCRHCKELSHNPLKCNELKKSDETALIEIEELEEETEKEEKSPVKCSNCSGEFLKREDSNQMVCPCGATMCSVCRQPFRECQHFNAEPRNESVHRLSFSSSNDDDDDVTETDELVPENDVERSSNCSENILEMLMSESENF